MTITILENQATFEFAIDTPNINIDTVLEVSSQHSNTILFSIPATLLNSNDRYSRFECTVPTNLWNEHKDGMHTYRVIEGETVYDTGSFKLVTTPGGTAGTEPYISNNETRQAKVIYRPDY